MTDFRNAFDDLGGGGRAGAMVMPWGRSASLPRAPAVDEETRWQAYQAWLRKSADGPGPVATPSQSVVTPRAPLDLEARDAERQSPPSRPAGARRSRRPLSVVFGLCAGLLGVAVMTGLELTTAPALAPAGGLRIEAEADGLASPQPRRPLPCFVNGRGVGDLPLGDCARRNGVASGPLEVGLEPVASPVVVPAAAAPRPLPASDTKASLRTVGEFYGALGRADAKRAAALTLADNRAIGPLSARELKRNYGALRKPLRVTHIEALSARKVFVRYRFVASDGAVCAGAADVDTASRGERTFISRVHLLNRC